MSSDTWGPVSRVNSVFLLGGGLKGISCLLGGRGFDPLGWIFPLEIQRRLRPLGSPSGRHPGLCVSAAGEAASCAGESLSGAEGRDTAGVAALEQLIFQPSESAMGPLWREGDGVPAGYSRPRVAKISLDRDRDGSVRLAFSDRSTPSGWMPRTTWSTPGSGTRKPSPSP